MTDKRFLLAVLAIALVGLGLRWYWILEVRPPDECRPPGTVAPAGCLALSGRPEAVNDPRYVHELANLIGDGKPFIDPFTYASTGEERPSAQNMPLFPVYLGAVSFLGGQSVDSHRLAAALLGAATVVVLGLVGRQLLAM